MNLNKDGNGALCKMIHGGCLLKMSNDKKKSILTLTITIHAGCLLKISYDKIVFHFDPNGSSKKFGSANN